MAVKAIGLKCIGFTLPTTEFDLQSDNKGEQWKDEAPRRDYKSAISHLASATTKSPKEENLKINRKRVGAFFRNATKKTFDLNGGHQIKVVYDLHGATTNTKYPSLQDTARHLPMELVNGAVNTDRNKNKLTHLKMMLKPPQKPKVAMSCDNLAFEFDNKKSTSPSVPSVIHLMRNAIREDLHPYGRGHLYRTVVDGERPIEFHDEEKLLMWLLTIVLILGFAASVILRSIMYHNNTSTPSYNIVSPLNYTTTR